MWRERIGGVIGVALAPLTAAGSFIRRARLFHPEGRVFRATVQPIALTEPYATIARRLEGEALVRMSGAWWRGGKEWPDVLGCAIRFRSTDVPSTEPRPGDQDLLLATVRWPWTTLLAPLGTNPHDFTANDYHGVSPFRVEGLGAAKWRLLSPHLHLGDGARMDALENAARERRAHFRLQVRHLKYGHPWVDIAELRLLEPMPIDQEALRFSPFRAGRGIHPMGLVQAMRWATYRASQFARPRRSRTISA